MMETRALLLTTVLFPVDAFQEQDDQDQSSEAGMEILDLRSNSGSLHFPRAAEDVFSSGSSSDTRSM